MTNEVIYVTNEGVSEYLNFTEKFELVEEVLGDNSVSFVSYLSPENHAYELLEEEAFINIGDMQYRIKQVVERYNRKEIYAQNVFFDLITVRREEPFGGNYTFQQFLDYLFEDTEWTYSGEVEGQMVIDRFGRDNVIKLVNRLCDAFECEYEILPNKEVVFKERIGEDKDFQYRYGHNIVAMSKTVDTTNLRTVIRGYGADDLSVIYYSPNVEVFGELEADPVQDERFSIEENFLEYVKGHLIDYPEVSIELDTIELLDRELGEDVWLIYEPLGIEFHTRVLSKTSIIRNDKLTTGSVVIGNVLPRDMSDIVEDVIEEVEEDKKRVWSKFEQTDEKIFMEVGRVEENLDEAIAQWSITADEIRGSVTSLKNYTDEEIGGVKETASSNFSILAGRINAKADYEEVSELGSRVNSVEFNMNAVEGELSTKVSQSDYTGEVMVSKINQTPSSVKIQAKNITLAGAVTVLSELSNNLGTITAGNINISEDVTIGRRLNVGSHWGNSEPKEITFGGVTGGSIRHRNDTLVLWSMNGTSIENYLRVVGEVDFSSVYSMRGVAQSFTNNLGIAYSSASNRIYFRINGSDIGHVNLE